MYNTLSTPKGKIYKLLLPDGSLVWLNAASSIRFPTAFTNGERNVEITGEVYFEVTKDAKKPFRVYFSSPPTGKEGREGAVEVLGTHFNINAYANEDAIRTTLLEGSVKVSAMSNRQSAILKPGEQVSMSQSSHLSQPIPVQTKKVMGWKDGYFSLDDLSLEALMREVERWYDVEVEYENGVPAKAFFGKVNRDLSLFDFMEGLKDWGVRFRLEGRKVIITGVEQ